MLPQTLIMTQVVPQCFEVQSLCHAFRHHCTHARFVHLPSSAGHTCASKTGCLHLFSEAGELISKPLVGIHQVIHALVAAPTVPIVSLQVTIALTCPCDGCAPAVESSVRRRLPDAMLAPTPDAGLLIFLLLCHELQLLLHQPAAAALSAAAGSRPPLRPPRDGLQLLLKGSDPVAILR